MLQNPPIQEPKIDKLAFKLEDANFKKIISPYKLSFEDQLKFNEDFDIEKKRPASSSAEDLKKFLKDKLNEAFEDENKLNTYQNAISTDKKSSDRGIHDGYHVANVALYARNFLKIYQQNKELFSPEIQKEIKEFDDPQKIRDLEILCLLHDVARVNKDLDQDEYKNAFYVALMLRAAEDERFQGNEISEEGLKMIMDLASKESKEKDKSLMSKLIQGADSLAILRVKKFNSDPKLFNPNLNNVYNDFKNIDHKDNADIRNKLITIWIGRMQSDILSIENKEHAEIKEQAEIKPIEFEENPLKEFFKHQKTQKLQQAFVVYGEINSRDETNDSEKFGGPVFVHVFAPLNPDALQKCDSKKFICATMLIDGVHVKHYAEWSWTNNPFLILDEDDTIFQAGFPTDVGSDILKKKNSSSMFWGFRGGLTDIQMSDYVASQWKTRPTQAYFDNMIFHQYAFYLKLKETSDRRSGDQTDISDGTYWLTNSSGERKQGRVGAERYGAEYSKPYFLREALSNELRHNECHIRNSVHVSHRVGISDNTFNFFPSANHQYSDSPESGLFRLQKYRNQINAEKQRLLALGEPMKDEKFRECVDFELSKVTSLFEKIHFLQQMRNDIKDNPDNKYWIKSSNKKRAKKSELDGFAFEISDVNQKIWSERKIDKINKNLVELCANLRDFEKEENFGFKDLIPELEGLTSGGCSPQSFRVKIADWKSKIMSDETNPQLQFAIAKVTKGLHIETKMGLHNVYEPQEFMVLTDEKLEEKFKEITKKILEEEGKFKLYFNTERYLDILRIFDREQITETFHKIYSSKDQDFDKIVFANKFPKSTKQEIEQLIDAGLDIHKFNDKEAEADCFGLRKSSQIIQPYSYETAKKSNNAQVVESLMEHGVLISDKFNLTGNDVEKNMAEFCSKLKAQDAEVLNSLKLALEKYETKENLKDVATLSFGGKEIKLNGYGLLRIFENNLIKDPSLEISQLFTKVNAFKASGQANTTTLVSVEAEIGFVGISQAPTLVIITPDNSSTITVDSAVDSAVDSGAGVGFRTDRSSPLTQLSPPSQTNNMT
jgi:hypothetical protein